MRTEWAEVPLRLAGAARRGSSLFGGRRWRPLRQLRVLIVFGRGQADAPVGRPP